MMQSMSMWSKTTRYAKAAKTSRLKDKDLKISDIKTKSKDNDKGSRSKICTVKQKKQGQYNLDRDEDHRLNDKSNLIDLTKERLNELTSGEIVSLKY
ncbi:hypothetical protein Tco_1402198 [Tanacetum coccineum]